MRVLFKGLQGGRIILNPERPMELLRSSRQAGAGIVLHLDDMIMSTEPMTAHDVLIDMAGFIERPFTPGLGPAKDFTHRAAMNKDGLSVDVWMVEESVDFPYAKDEMDDLLDYLEGHKRLKRMPENFELEVLVMDDAGSPAFSYTRKGLAALDVMGNKGEIMNFPERAPVYG